MKRKPRRVKEQGSFLKRQLKGSARSGAFKQPWEEEGGEFLAGVQAAVPSGHSFLLNAAAPGPLSPPFPSCRRILSNSRVRTQGTFAPFHLSPPASPRPRPRPRPVLGALITELPAQRAPNPRTQHPRDSGASSPSRGCHGQKFPPSLAGDPRLPSHPRSGKAAASGNWWLQSWGEEGSVPKPQGPGPAQSERVNLSPWGCEEVG